VFSEVRDRLINTLCFGAGTQTLLAHGGAHRRRFRGGMLAASTGRRCSVPHAVLALPLTAVDHRVLDGMRSTMRDVSPISPAAGGTLAALQTLVIGRLTPPELAVLRCRAREQTTDQRFSPPHVSQIKSLSLW
jgi:hypothetical protein